jgi:hypothetical protein
VATGLAILPRCPPGAQSTCSNVFARKNNTGTRQVMNWTGTSIVGNPIFAAVAIDDPGAQLSVAFAAADQT